MKTALFILCILSAPLALGQTNASIGALSSEPVITEFANHSARASQTPLASQQTLLLSSEYATGHGVRPLWEVATDPHVAPLGDTARLLKDEHAQAKKAKFVWVN